MANEAALAAARAAYMTSTGVELHQVTGWLDDALEAAIAAFLENKAPWASDVMAVVDGGNSITVHFSEIKSAKAFRDTFPSDRIATEFFAPVPMTEGGRLFSEMVNLVIAAREAFDCAFLPEEESRTLDKALEPFASRVRYANEPDEDAIDPTGSSLSSTDGGKNGG